MFLVSNGPGGVERTHEDLIDSLIGIQRFLMDLVELKVILFLFQSNYHSYVSNGPGGVESHRKRFKKKRNSKQFLMDLVELKATTF